MNTELRPPPHCPPLNMLGHHEDFKPNRLLVREMRPTPNPTQGSGYVLCNFYVSTLAESPLLNLMMIPAVDVKDVKCS
jgi:hypothetical protein